MDPSATLQKADTLTFETETQNIWLHMVYRILFSYHKIHPREIDL